MNKSHKNLQPGDLLRTTRDVLCEGGHSSDGGTGNGYRISQGQVVTLIQAARNMKGRYHKFIATATYIVLDQNGIIRYAEYHGENQSDSDIMGWFWRTFEIIS